MKIAPVVYSGFQSGFGVMPGFHLWTLTRDVCGHPAGATISERALKQLGLDLPIQEIRAAQLKRQAVKNTFVL